MKNHIKRLLRENLLLESHYQDQALDNLSKVGSFDRLRDIDKLILLEPSQDISKLRTISFTNIFKELGGTFGKHMVKVKVKDLKDQKINHKFSKQMAGEVGWLSPYVHYDDGNNQPYVSVTFDNLEHHNIQGDTSYQSMPIMLANLYPIGYGDEPIDFTKHAAKREMERKEFLDKLGFDDEMF